MAATKTTAAAVATRARLNALTKLGRMFNCTPVKAEERMNRVGPRYGDKYKPYRVAFFNFIDDAITNVFSHVDNGHATIMPMHWSAVDKADASVQSNPLGRLHGSHVSYWVPNKAAA
jgi:hypothetical protein